MSYRTQLRPNCGGEMGSIIYILQQGFFSSVVKSIYLFSAIDVGRVLGFFFFSLFIFFLEIWFHDPRRHPAISEKAWVFTQHNTYVFHVYALSFTLANCSFKRRISSDIVIMQGFAEWEHWLSCKGGKILSLSVLRRHLNDMLIKWHWCQRLRLWFGTK